MSFQHPDHLQTAFVASFTAGDVEALLDLYETHAVQLQQDGRTLTGQNALRSVFVSLFEAGVTISGEQRQTVMADDLALTSTRYAFERNGEDGMSTTVQMATTEVSRRQADGTWRVVIDAPAFA